MFSLVCTGLNVMGRSRAHLLGKELELVLFLRDSKGQFTSLYNCISLQGRFLDIFIPYLMT